MRRSFQALVLGLVGLFGEEVHAATATLWTYSGTGCKGKNLQSTIIMQLGDKAHHQFTKCTKDGDKLTLTANANYVPTTTDFVLEKGLDCQDTAAGDASNKGRCGPDIGLIVGLVILGLFIVVVFVALLVLLKSAKAESAKNKAPPTVDAELKPTVDVVPAEPVGEPVAPAA